MAQSNVQLFEVFIRLKNGLNHQHVGSLHAENQQQAMDYARDCYSQSDELGNIWVVQSENIVSSQKEDRDSFFSVSDKPYRHASHYTLPDEIKNM